MTSQEFDVQTIQTALMRLLKVSTPQEGIAVLQQHPELLTEYAEALLTALIENAQQQGHKSFTKALSSLHHLITHYRETLT